MQPSSLVFLAVIGVWAAFFVQYWVRRRDHLATAQAVDELSESLRILDRGRAQGGSAGSAGSLEAGRTAGTADTYAAAQARAQIFRRQTQAAPAPASPAAPERSQDVRTPTLRPGRRIRGLLLLASLVAATACLGAAALGLVPWLAPGASVVAVLGALAWTRRGVAAERAARTSRRVAPRAGLATPSARSVVTAPPAQAPAPARAAAPAQAPAPVPALGPEAVEQETAVAPAPPDRVERGELFDVQAVEAGARQAAGSAAISAALRPLVDDDDIPLTWDPVPVPRPTYAMKSRVTRPAPTAADLVGDADTEYAAHDEPTIRRVAGA